MSLLLDNAITSIRAGVAGYETHDRAQLLSAVRNIHAGVLLLYKEALRRYSPKDSNEVLVKERIVPRLIDGRGLVFSGDGRRTATVPQIKERFAGLGINTDWKRYERVARVRNDIEHHFTEASESAIRSLVGDAFVLTRDFLSMELEEDPVELLGQETWTPMLKAAEVMERERKDCEKALASVNWGSDTLSEAVQDAACDQCGSPLLMPDPAGIEMGVKCRSCGNHEEHAEFVERAIADHLVFENYSSLKDGADPPYVSCPFCQSDTYIIDERQCAACGESCVHECIRCEIPIPPEELSDGSLCGWCSHMMSKD